MNTIKKLPDGMLAEVEGGGANASGEVKDNGEGAGTEFVIQVANYDQNGQITELINEDASQSVGQK